jgi:undecaprenyl-diphosphatase
MVGRQRIELHQLKVPDGVLLGFAQAMALIPGVSRSGATLTAGLFLGLTRATAVRYGFLLAIPAVVASGIFQIPDVLAGDGVTVPQMVVATVIAFVIGYATIAWLLRYVERHSVYLFVWYRVVLGAVLLVALSAGWIAAT